MEEPLAVDVSEDGEHVAVQIAALPESVASAADIDLDLVGGATLSVRVSGAEQHVELPFSVDAESARVRFKRSTRTLTFTAKRGDAGAAAHHGAAAHNGAAVDAHAEAEAHPPLGAAAHNGCGLEGESASAATPAAVSSEIGAANPHAPPEPRLAEAPSIHATSPPAPAAQPAPAASLSPVGSATAAQPAGTPAGARADQPGPASQAPHHPNQQVTPLPPHQNGQQATKQQQQKQVQQAAPAVPPTAAEKAAAAKTTAAAAAAAASLAKASLASSAGTATAAMQPPQLPQANAQKVAAAFTPTGGTASRADGFVFEAPDVPPPPPLPPGLPPVAEPIDCRYLAVANGLRISAHAQTAALAELLGVAKRPSAAASKVAEAKADQIWERVAATLDAYGYAVLDNYISEAAIRAARAELAVMQPHFSPGMIWVGKEAEAGAQIAVTAVRGDVVLWLDDAALGATAFIKDGVRRQCSFVQLQQLLADVDELAFERLRRHLPYLAGLHRRSDAMVALYPGKGARFAKHVDNTTTDGRRLTVVTYLNPGWREEQGGALRLFPVREGTSPHVDVLPLSGRVALFLSAEVAHEVMPAFDQRYAVTLWYYDAGEHAAALAAAKALPGATSRPSTQAAAAGLLRDLLADEAAAGIEATSEGCRALALRLSTLEPGARQLIAAVVGAPSVATLMESWQSLTPSRLRDLRESLRTMGLDSQHHAPDTSMHARS